MLVTPTSQGHLRSNGDRMSNQPIEQNLGLASLPNGVSFRISPPLNRNSPTLLLKVDAALSTSNEWVTASYFESVDEGHLHLYPHPRHLSLDPEGDLAHELTAVGRSIFGLSIDGSLLAKPTSANKVAAIKNALVTRLEISETRHSIHIGNDVVIGEPQHHKKDQRERTTHVKWLQIIGFHSRGRFDIEGAHDLHSAILTGNREAINKSRNWFKDTFKNLHLKVPVKITNGRGEVDAEALNEVLSQHTTFRQPDLSMEPLTPPRVDDGRGEQVGK